MASSQTVRDLLSPPRLPADVPGLRGRPSARFPGESVRLLRLFRFAPLQFGLRLIFSHFIRIRFAAASNSGATVEQLRLPHF